MIETPSFLFLSSELLFLAAGIFLGDIITEAKKGGRLSGTFGLWIMVLMLAWSVSEVVEDALPTADNNPLHYLHVVVMSSFAVFLTLRWKWASSQAKSEPAPKEPRQSSV